MGDTGTEHLAMDGRFILLDLIGQGGVGEVWRATEVASGRPIALKLLREEFSNDPQLRRRFTREARAASAMRHENIGAVYDYGADLNGRLFIAMEFLDGPSLTEAIETGISARKILEFSSQLLAGLAHAHARGVIHRDLKPDNIVLDKAELPTQIGISKLVDFGIATATFDQTNTRETMQGEVVGTPRYMSPEQARGERELSPRSDIYNAGLILYELVSGNPPFQGARGLDVMSRHVHDEIPTLSPRQGLDVPDELLDVIVRALKKSPNERYDSAGEMRRAIGAIMAAIAQNRVYDRLPLQADELFGAITRTNRPREEDKDTAQYQPAHTPQGLFYPNGPSFLVGREEEKKTLLDLVDETVEAGLGSIVICEGETGVGKSLLTTWLREQVIEEGWMRAESGRFVEHGQGSLWGLIEVLEHIFHTRGLNRAKARARIEEGLDTDGDASMVELDIVMDFLRPEQLPGSRPGDHHDRLVPALGSVIERYIGQRPTLLVLEDIHLAGRDLLRLLGYLAHRMHAQKIPILIVATTRKESIQEAPELKRALDELTSELNPRCHLMSLDRFDGARGRQLIGACLACDDELEQLILDRAMGNPLHIVMLLRYLFENDHLTQRGATWCMHDPARARSVVPPGLSDLFEHRLLEVEEQHGTTGRLERVLQLAGLVGMQFHYHILQHLAVALDGEERAYCLESDLNTLVGEGFLREVHKGYDWYRFEHALVRDWLVHRIAESQRATYHKAIAKAFESVFGETTHEFSFQLADHWRDAGNVAKASHWYQVAGLDAIRTSPRRAQRAYQACLEMMNAQLSTDGAEVLDEEAYESAGLSTTDYLGVLSRLGDLSEGFGRFEEAEKAYRRVVRTVAKMVTTPTDGILGALGYSWLGLGEVAWQRGDFEAADWAFRKVREIAQRSEELASLDIDAVLGLAHIAWHRGDYNQAKKLAQVANKDANSLQRSHEEAESLWMLGETARILGQLTEAKKHYEQSMAIFRREKMLHGIATNLLSMAQLARYQKRFSEARDLYIRALAHYDDLGDRRGAGRCHNGLGDVARLAKEHELADHHYGCALEIMETIGAEYDVAIVMANLGINAFDRGLLNQAEAYLSASQVILRAEDFPYLLAGIEYNLALVKASKGETEVARSLVARGTDRNRNNPIADIDYAQPLERIARLQADEGDWEAAVELWTRAGKIYEELGLNDDRKRIEATLKEAEGLEST